MTKKYYAKLKRKIAELELAHRPGWTADVRIVVDLQPPTPDRVVIDTDLIADEPDDAPTAPVPAVEAEPIDAAQPKADKEGKDGSRREWHLPAADKPTRGVHYTDEEIAQARMYLRRGMRGIEVARVMGMSQQHVSNLKLDRTRRAVAAAPDPRGNFKRPF